MMHRLYFGYLYENSVVESAFCRFVLLARRVFECFFCHTSVAFGSDGWASPPFGCLCWKNLTIQYNQYRRTASVPFFRFGSHYTIYPLQNAWAQAILTFETRLQNMFFGHRSMNSNRDQIKLSNDQCLCVATFQWDLIDVRCEVILLAWFQTLGW